MRIRAAAIDAYTQSNADRYASSHDLGPDPDYGNSLSAPAPGSGDQSPDDTGTDGSGQDAQNCEPGYSPCLESGVADYDCTGGEGDGPNYTGRVEVTGSDPFGLDRDGDGVGCE